MKNCIAGARLHKLMLVSNITKAQLCNEIELTKAEIEKLYTYDEINSKVAKAISDYFHVTIDYLLGITDGPDELSRTETNRIAMLYIMNFKPHTSAKDLCTKAGVDDSTLSAYVRGTTDKLSRASAKAWAKYLDLDIEWLTDGRITNDVHEVQQLIIDTGIKETLSTADHKAIARELYKLMESKYSDN